MKDTPTNGPIKISKTHQALDATSSRHSLSISHVSGDLGERKKHLFQSLVGLRVIPLRSQARKVCDGAFSAHSPATQQNEPVAESSGIADLMDGQEHGSALGRLCSQYFCDVP